jgi:hypothetical protein
VSGDLVEPGFAVVDTETTGLWPGSHDRIVEIAVVAVDAKGGVVEEWTTLVNPCRDVGPSSLHGLRPRDLVDAPTFAGGDVPHGTLRLIPGDRICFTGEMSMPRSDLQGLALAAGLEVSSGVSKKTTMLVCADTDAMSGKARKARDLGTTVISEPKFHQLLAAMDER